MHSKRKGFTVVEVLVVIVLLAMIASLIVPRFFQGIGEQKRKVSKTKMAIIEDALARFSFDCGRFPDDSEGLDVLVEAPDGLEDKWKGPYLKRSQLLDAWDNPYDYIAEGQINAGSFDLISYGADGMEGGEDENEDIYND